MVDASETLANRTNAKHFPLRNKQTTMANLPVPAAKEPHRASLESPQAGEEDDEIDAVETAFLKGSFREALTAANRYLIHKKANTSTTATTETVRIRTPLLPRLDDPEEDAAAESSTTMVVHGGESDATDRAAAVALQSWYELSKLEKKNNKKTSRAHQIQVVAIYT